MGGGRTDWEDKRMGLQGASALGFLSTRGGGVIMPILAISCSYFSTTGVAAIRPVLRNMRRGGKGRRGRFRFILTSGGFSEGRMGGPVLILRTDWSTDE